MSFKKRILCIIYEQGNFQLARILAQTGRDSAMFDTILWSPYALPNGPSYSEAALAAQSVYVEENTLEGGLADIQSLLSNWLTAKPARLPLPKKREVQRWFKRKLESPAKILIGKLERGERLDVLRAADRNLRRTAFCEDWLVRLGIDAIVFAEDNVERDSFAWIAAARRRGIRTVVSSYGALSLNEAEDAYKYSKTHAIGGPQLSLFQQHLPKWLAEGPDYVITRLPWIEAIGRELISEAPFNPWLVNTGQPDLIALESRVMEKNYLTQNFHSTRLAVLGHPLHDRLAAVRQEKAERRAYLAKRYNFDIDKPFIVVAMPPNQLTRRDSEFATYSELTAAFHRIPEEITSANIVISPHPTTSIAEIEDMEAAGARVERVSVAELLPLADLFVASVSTTIKWALALGIAVIDFDCYGYNYPDYRDLEQVVTVSDTAEFKNALLRWRTGETRPRLDSAARRDAVRWGEIDGHALDRLIASCLSETV
ncbi:hypothetical protein NGM99_10145 [Mesorhizobium sp. RP14(2022)]|uniref:Uncharacterized protein n=1 Tax=Mesorhizobium liriopis TaxID=2953882 RepID=A0ABT1C844_9HYPH|nr:hypothetical protein [Mesorhizobium liriopis]MCO6050151.1 hypothetical protein [Mesorhizobium liriopis]